MAEFDETVRDNLQTWKKSLDEITNWTHHLTQKREQRLLAGEKLNPEDNYDEILAHHEGLLQLEELAALNEFSCPLEYSDQLEELIDEISEGKVMLQTLLTDLSNDLRQEGNVYYRSENFSESLKLYSLALKLTPENALVLTNVALAYFKLQDYEQSKENALLAIEYDGENVKAHICALKSAVLLSEIDLARRIIDDMPAAGADHPDVVEYKGKLGTVAKDLGNAAFKTGDFSSAIKYYSIGIELDPKNHLLFSNRSACYQSLKQWEMALDDAQQVVRLQQFFPKGYLHMIRCLLQLGRIDSAKSQCVSAMQTLSQLNDWNTHLPSFQDLINQIDMKIAENRRRAETMSAQDRARAESYKDRGNSMYKDEMYSEAITLYSQAIAACPVEGSYYGNRAAAWMMLKEHEKALQDCDKALEFEVQAGSMNKIRQRKVNAMFNLGQYDQADKFLSDFLLLHPDNTLQKMRESIAEIQNNLSSADDALIKREYR